MTQPPIKPGAPPALNKPVFKPKAMRISAGHDPNALGGLKTLYWGPPFSYKTKLMLSWPGVVIVQLDPDRATVYAHEFEPPLIEVADWDEWNDVILPKITSRQIKELIWEIPGFENYARDVAKWTIAIDSFTRLGELAEEKAKSLEADQRRWYGKKYDLLLDTMNKLNGIVTVHPKLPPPVNLIGSIHERERFIDVPNPNGKGMIQQLDRIGPSITGGMFEKFPQYWSTILLTDTMIPSNKEGDALPGAKHQHFCHTVPPDRFRRMGDRLSGGRLPPLPPKVEGTYASLAKHWFPTNTNKPQPKGQPK